MFLQICLQELEAAARRVVVILAALVAPADEHAEAHEMEWPQHFDGKGWQNDLAGKFGIRSIPATSLIGKDGKVAASDLRGEALEAKVAELLK